MKQRPYIPWLVIWLSLLGGWSSLLAQPTPIRVAGGDTYPFIRADLNYIDNNYRGLLHFYRQLERLEKGEVRTVNIVHIGDSHIQADWFSGQLRLALQQRFGSAGRGLVFPYRVARTNSPSDIYTASDATWVARRTIEQHGQLPIGLCGITLQTRDPNFLLELSLRPEYSRLDYAFNKITLFTDKGPASFDLELSSQVMPAPAAPAAPPTSGPVKDLYHEVRTGETLGIIAARYKVPIQQLKTLNQLSGSRIYAGQHLLVRRSKVLESETPARPEPAAPSAPLGNVLTLSGSPPQAFASSLYLEAPTHRLYLRGRRQHPQQSTLTLYGMVLENYLEAGILYHMIGVNGAKFADYNAAEHFMTQLQALRPDLIIISLGTNETVFSGFNPDRFYQEVDHFVHQLEQYLPHANILLTTPPDAYRARRYPNPQVEQARNVLLGYALANDLACWNFYDIMGGPASINTWHGSGLAQSDRLHLTQPGYELAARLLYQALINGYGSYRSAR